MKRNRNKKDLTEAEYYHDPLPGWGGSGEACEGCGTREYFEGTTDESGHAVVLCSDCLERRRMDYE